MVDPILFGDFIIPTPFFFTPPENLLIATSSIAACNTLFTFWLAYHLRLTHAAVMGLLDHTHARTLPPYLIATIIPASTTTSVFNISAKMIRSIILHMSLQLFCCFSCVVRYINVVFLDFEMRLEIKSKGRCIFLALQKVSGCPTNYVITGSTQNSHLPVHGWIRPYLSIICGDLHIAHAHSGRPLPLLNLVHISLIHRFKLGSTFANDWHCPKRWT